MQRISLLYKAFGIDAELLIDHMRGRNCNDSTSRHICRRIYPFQRAGAAADYEYEEGVLGGKRGRFIVP